MTGRPSTRGFSIPLPASLGYWVARFKPGDDSWYKFQTANAVIASASEAIHLFFLVAAWIASSRVLLAMTLRHDCAISPHAMREVFVYFPALSEERAQGMPGARCAR
jgi:hypothetical protein